jgi:hypothetical protein
VAGDALAHAGAGPGSARRRREVALARVQHDGAAGAQVAH